MKNKEAKSIFSSLENFSSIPPPELWDKIEAQLDEPKKKKRAIIWWSIAASLVVGLSVPTILYFKSNQGNFNGNTNFNDNGIVNVDQHTNKNGVVDENKKENEIRIVNDNTIFNGKRNQYDKINKSNIPINTPVAAVAVSNNSSETKKHKEFNYLNQQKKDLNYPTSKEETRSAIVVANQNSASVISKSELVKDKSVQTTNLNANTIAVVSGEKNSISGANANKTITANAISKSVLVIDKSVQVSNLYANDKVAVSTKNNNTSKSNIYIKTVENTSSKDSLNKIKSEVAELENTLMQLDKDKTKKKVIAESIDKWSLQVFAGVMSSQNYNNEKALGNTVASKQSSGYGVKTNYKLNKKWGVSSGFKINELGQKIAGVSYYKQQNYSGMVSGTLPIASDTYQPSSAKNSYQIVLISNNQDYMFASNSKAENGFEKGNVVYF